MRRTGGDLAAWVLAGAPLVLLLPSSNLMVFSGIPLSTLVEVACLALIVPLIARSVRLAYRDNVLSRRYALPVVTTMVGAALLVKVVIALAGTHDGFAACYRPIDNARAGCERSYENPLNNENVTRFDRQINFRAADGLTSSNWNLSFVNSSRFNLLEQGQIARERLPFTAEWKGTVDRNESVEVTYVGEVDLSFDGESADLPANYETKTTETVPVGEGVEAITVRYRFAPAELAEDAPYATLQLHDPDGEPIETAGPAMPWRIVAVIGDIAIALVMASLAYSYAMALRRSWWLIAVGAVLAGASYVIPGPFIAPYPWSAAVAGVIFLVLWMSDLRRQDDAAMLGAYFAAIAFAAALVLPLFDFGSVLYRGVGEDQLTYESQARSILESGSLRGEEDVFVYSPAFRYVLFLLHLLVGDADTSIFIVSALLLLTSIFFVTHRVWPALRLANGSKKKGTRKPAQTRLQTQFEQLIAFWRDDPLTAIVFVCAPAVALLFAMSPYSTGMMTRALTSEFPTWILFLFGCGLLVARPTARGHVLGICLLALALTIRMDQTPGHLWVMAVTTLSFLAFRDPQGKDRRGVAIAAAVIATVGLLLPAAHNLYFGQKLAVLPQTPDLPVNFPLPLGDLPGIITDGDTRAIFVTQVAGVFGFDSAREAVEGSQIDIEAPLQLVLHLLQAVWVAALVVAFRDREWLGRRSLAWLATPLIFLLPHISIQVYLAYPRHVVIGHLAFAVTALVAAGALLHPEEEEPLL